ncbi:hypothetical protein [Geobacter sp.]|uniref:hypothetical protein n=1 Tax=Geobacter sp. TaxID=46610 RepID=UPI0027BAAA9E|nr:hypothetical protein [Geobacter sp.]
MSGDSRATGQRSMYATPGELFDKYSAKAANPANLTAVQNIVSGAIGSYMAFACKNGLLAESIVVGVGTKSGLFFSVFFDIAVEKEDGLQATISSSFGTVAQIAVSKAGEKMLYRAIGQRVAGIAAQRILVCAGIALAPEIAVVAGAVGIAFMAWKGGDWVNGFVDKGFEKYDAFKKARRRKSDYPTTDDKSKPSSNSSTSSINYTQTELQLISFWLLCNDISPYIIPCPLTQQYIDSNFRRIKR